MSARGVGLHLTVLAIGLSACGPKQVSYQLTIVTKTCTMETDPFSTVGFLRVRVLGPDITTPLEVTSSTGAMMHQIVVPEIPVGKARQVEVRGYDSDPHGGGKVISIGITPKFDVPKTIPLPNDPSLSLTVFLRKVNALTPISTAAMPTKCTSLTQARGAHTATLLNDGRVFIAGGYNLDITDPAKQDALSSTEIYDPRTGDFVPAHDINAKGTDQPVPKAFHTASLLPSGQVLLWGGEVYPQTNVTTLSLLPIIYDPDRDATGPVTIRSVPPFVQRTRHSAVVDGNGKVLIVGGLTMDAGVMLPTDVVEGFDPDMNTYAVVAGSSQARNGASVVSVENGTVVAVAGGSDGFSVRKDVTLFQWGGTNFEEKPLASAPMLAQGRRGAAIATINSSNDLVLAGGYSDPVMPAPLSTSEIVSAQTGSVTAGAVVGSRGDSCAVSLPSGDIFISGGQTVDASNMGQSVDSTLTIHVDAMGGTEPLGGPTLAAPRMNHTCTLLQDGSVLITGGINLQNGIFNILQDAYIYQPAPTD